MDNKNSEIKANKNIFKAYIDALKKYFQIKGRTSRYDYWGFLFMDFLINIALILLMFLVLPLMGVFALLFKIYSIALVIPRITISVRRFHDTGKSFAKWCVFPVLGFFILGILISILGKMNAVFILTSSFLTIFSIVMFVCLCRKGHEEANDYGPSIEETAAQRRKGIIFPIVLIFVPIILPFMIGAYSGYSKAMYTYEANTSILEMYGLLAEAKGLTGEPALDSDSPEDWKSTKKTEIFKVLPQGGEIRVKRSGEYFMVTHNMVTKNLCQFFSIYNWPENSDFVSIELDGADDCSGCTSKKPCRVIWQYK